MTLKDLLSRNYILLVNLSCFVGFCVQLANVVDTYVHPTQTTMEVNEKDLQDSDFPLLFKSVLIQVSTIQQLMRPASMTLMASFLARAGSTPLFLVGLVTPLREGCLGLWNR